MSIRPSIALLLSSLSTFSMSLHADPQISSKEFNFQIPRSARKDLYRHLAPYLPNLGIGYYSTDDAVDKELIGPFEGRYSVDQLLKMTDAICAVEPANVTVYRYLCGTE